MKILQIIHSFLPYNTAGSEVHTYHLSCELAKLDKVFVFHRINDLQKKEYEVTYNQYNRLNIYAINNTFRFCKSFEMVYNNEFITEKFSELLDKVKPDIAHIQHLLFLSTGIIEEIKKRKIPIIFTLHDYWLICPQGQLLKNNLEICRNHSLAGCVVCLKYQLNIREGVMGIYHILREKFPHILVQSLKNIYLGYAKLPSLFKNGKESNQIKMRIEHIKKKCSMVDIFIAPSKFVRDRFIKFGFPEEKIIYKPNGFQYDLFKDVEKKESGKTRFGFIGTLLPSKGVHILIQSFRNICNKNTELKIYGKMVNYKGFEHYLKYLKKAARNRNISFVGEFDNSQIGKIFCEIDVLVVPSIWLENAPLVIQEAFLAKTPVIASRIGGIPELVDDGVNGLLFEPGDSDDLKEKLEYVIDNPEIIEKFKEHMPKVKSIEEDAKEIEEIYAKLIAGSKL